MNNKSINRLYITRITLRLGLKSTKAFSDKKVLTSSVDWGDSPHITNLKEFCKILKWRNWFEAKI